MVTRPSCSTTKFKASIAVALAIGLVASTGIDSAAAGPDSAKTKQEEKRKAACKTKANRIYHAVLKNGGTYYFFCDGSVVTKRADGTMGLQTSAMSRHPEYESYTHSARYRLEVAEHHAQVLNSETANREKALAHEAFEKRVASFQAKHGWSTKRYYRAVRRTKIKADQQ